MNNDEFDQFVFHDAIERGSLKIKDARARANHHSSWIHHAIVRLGYAEGVAERRAARREIEQDIRHIQARYGWGEEMMSAFHRRQQAMQAPSPEAGAEETPEPGPAPN